MPEDLRQLGTPVETKEGAQSKADAAESNATDYTDTAVSEHENSTSGVHGVGTSDVASTDDLSDIQDSTDVNHDQTSNRNHDGDDLSPDSIDAESVSTEKELIIPMYDTIDDLPDEPSGIGFAYVEDDDQIYRVDGEAL